MSKLKKALELAKKARNTNDKNIYKEKPDPPVYLERKMRRVNHILKSSILRIPRPKSWILILAN